MAKHAKPTAKQPAGHLVEAVIDAVTERCEQDRERRRELFAPLAAPRAGSAAAKRAEKSAQAEQLSRLAAAFEESGALVLRDVPLGKRVLPLLVVDACCGALVLVDATPKSLASDPEMRDLVARVGHLHDCLAELVNGTSLRWRKRDWSRLPWNVALMLLRLPRTPDGQLREGGGPDCTWWPTEWPLEPSPAPRARGKQPTKRKVRARG